MGMWISFLKVRFPLILLNIVRSPCYLYSASFLKLSLEAFYLITLIGSLLSAICNGVSLAASLLLELSLLPLITGISYWILEGDRTIFRRIRGNRTFRNDIHIPMYGSYVM